MSETHEKIVIIGSGPAGLTAAWELAKGGFAVTVFESLSVPGGMLRTGIPSHRLPKYVVDAEIDAIKALGVEILTDTTVDKAFFDGLIAGEEYEAVFIATGAFVSRRLRIEGEDLPGMVSALDILQQYNMTDSAPVGKNVVVIGGGNVATDAAGAALRCGAEQVRLFCLEDRSAMPAHEWEIAEIAAEGVELNPAWGPRAILSKDGKLTGIQVVKCTSVLDESGRFAPVYDEKSLQDIPADMVITAIGQSPDLRFLSEGIGTYRGTVQVDPYTMETNLPGVFAGGDAVAGTASLIEAITAGKTAAQSIMRYIERGPEKP